MTEMQIANILQASLALTLWLIVIFKIVPTWRVDSFRQKMFCVRDEMFDFAAGGGIAFDDHAYVLLRQQMNGLIRHGHRLTFFQTLMTKAIWLASGREHEMHWHESWEAALASIEDDGTRAKMRAFHERAVLTAVKYLILGSPILCLAIAFAASVLLAQGAALGTGKLLNAAEKKLLRGPLLDRRLIEESAVGCLG